MTWARLVQRKGRVDWVQTCATPVQRKGGLIAVKSRISGKEAVYVARESERRRPVKLLASDRVDGVSVDPLPSETADAKNPVGDKATAVVADDWKETLKRVGGSQSDDWNHVLGNQAIQSLWIKQSDNEVRARHHRVPNAAGGIRMESSESGGRKRSGIRRSRVESRHRLPSRRSAAPAL